MNNKRAIEYLRESFCNDGKHGLEEMHNKVLSLAIEALERQEVFENEVSNISDWFVNNKEELFNIAFNVCDREFDIVEYRGLIDKIETEDIIENVVEDIYDGILNVLKTFMVSR